MKRIVTALALVVASLFISILLAELILRNYFPVGVGIASDYRVPHPVFGWVLEPGASYLNKMPEHTVQVQYNSMGWRDIEHKLENDRDAFRIVVIGDSFMEAYSVELEDMFHRHMERLAGNEGVNIEVINLAVGGYGTLQEYLVFRDIGQHFKPDIVLLGIYLGNDIRNNSLDLESIIASKSMKVNSRPFLDFSDQSSWSITRVDYEGAWNRYLAATALKQSAIQELADQSALVQAALQAIKTIKTVSWSKKQADTNDNLQRNERQKARNLALFGVNYCQEQPAYTRAWGTTGRILEHFRDDVSSAGGTLFVFTIPALHEVDEEVISTIADYELVCLEDAPAYERLAGILKELDIDFVDLLPGFRELTRIDNRKFFHPSDRHWNEQGHYTAATIVHSALKDKKLLPSGITNHSSQ